MDDAANRELTVQLKAIVIENTVVGGYPDTMAIARAAFDLGRAAIDDEDSASTRCWVMSQFEKTKVSARDQLGRFSDRGHYSPRFNNQRRIVIPIHSQAALAA